MGITTQTDHGLSFNGNQMYIQHNHPDDPVTLLTVQHDGSVGIGTTNPSAKLDIHTTGASAWGLKVRTDNGDADSIKLVGGGGDSDVKFVVKGSGNVGIGTTSPNTDRLKIVATHSGAGKVIHAGSSHGEANGFVLQGNGNVGIGTTNPRTKFEVANAASNSALLFNVDTGENSKASIQSVDGDQILNTRPLLLNPAGGNVGIGTSNPQSPFTVAHQESRFGVEYPNQLGWTNTDPTRLVFQDYGDFWIGAGNGTWFTGAANTKTQASGLAADAAHAHDLLLTTMSSDSAHDRGITFASTNGSDLGGSNNTNTTAGWRLGKWHSGDAADSSMLVVDGGLNVKGGNTDEYDYYGDDFSAYRSSKAGGSYWSGDTGWVDPSITASTAIQIQSGNAGTNTRNPALQFHQYGYGGVQIRYDGPNDRLRFEDTSSDGSRMKHVLFTSDNRNATSASAMILTVAHQRTDNNGSGIDLVSGNVSGSAAMSPFIRFYDMSASTNDMTSNTVGDANWGLGVDDTGVSSFKIQYGGGSASQKLSSISSGSTRLFIDGPTGRVGIGTTSPIEKLHVNSGTGNVPALFESSDSLSIIRFKDNSTNTDVGIGASANDGVFYAGGSEAIRIDSDGNVGIGTTNPSGGEISGKALQIEDSAAPTLRLHRINGQGGTVQDYSLYAGSLAFAIHDNKDNQARLVIKDGNVGIGTTNPSKKLTVIGGSSLSGGGQHYGNHEFAATTTSTAYHDAAIEIREENYGTASANAPRLAFHWGGRVASQISIDTDAAITIRDNPGTGYEDLKAATIYSNDNRVLTIADLGYTESGRNYPVEISGDKLFVNVPWTNTQLTTEQVQDIVGGMVSSNSETNISVTYNDTTGKLNFVSTNTQLTTEQVQDIVGGMVSSNSETNISVTYNDTTGKLNFAGTTFAATNHNHTYDVNNSWLRDNGDNANVKLYGNSRQMVFRTDGETEYASGIGAYAFVWMYGGDAAGNRRMMLDHNGELWTSSYGWLHTKFAASSHTHAISNITGLQTALDGKAASSHSHAISNITGLQTALDGKAASSHSHSNYLTSNASDTVSGTLTYATNLRRNAHNKGHFEGGHNNIGTSSAKTSPIYTIGSSYNPNDSTLGNMYGIGFCSSGSATFIPSTLKNGNTGWGLYVAADGDARIFLNSSSGTVESTGHHYAGGYRCLTTNDEGSGKGIDADTVDGLHSGSFLRSGSSTQTVYGGQIIASNWLRNNASGEGLYNTVNDAHFYSAGNNYWHLNGNSGNQSSGGLILYDRHNASEANGTGRKGYLYWDSSGFGLLSNDGSWAFRHNNTHADIYGTIRQDGTHTVWHAGNDGSGSGLDADKVDGLHSGSFLRSNAADTFTGTITMGTQISLVANNYGRGVFGLYSPTRYQHVWSMGAAYKTSDDGTGYGNMYGLTYTHTNIGTGTNQAISGLSHQLQHRINGVLTAVMGDGIWTRGNVTAYSDIAVKTNLEIIPDAVTKICQLNGYTYERTDYVKDENDPDAPDVLRQAGVVAQEVEKVLPEVVSGPEGNKAVAYGNIVALLIQAVKEQQAQLDKQQQLIDQLINK